jgi:hypothetical protein
MVAVCAGSVPGRIPGSHRPGMVPGQRINEPSLLQMMAMLSVSQNAHHPPESRTACSSSASISRAAPVIVVAIGETPGARFLCDCSGMLEPAVTSGHIHNLDVLDSVRFHSELGEDPVRTGVGKQLQESTR